MHRSIVIFSALLTVGCAGRMLSYGEAHEQLTALSGHHPAKKWGENVVAPFLQRNIEPIVVDCTRHVPEAVPVTARFVIDVSRRSIPPRIADEAPTPFSDCLRTGLQALNWPKAPPGIRFMPIEITGGNDSLEAKDADEVIISVTPDNTSRDEAR